MSGASSIQSPEERPELVKYELVEEVGHGGMATVYRALDRRLGREVAVKVIHKHLRESGEVAARFSSEARAVAKLRHPNIVEVYDVSDDEEPERYLVVELVRGTTLRKLLQKETKLPAEIAAAVALEIAGALEHAHQHGVIHRDVKPENVLVEAPEAASDEGGRAGTSGKDRAHIKITDFGIAKLLDAQGVTSTGQVLGSPAHMAPEQIEGDKVSARADVFALGVLLYESMVGALPFEGRNPAQVLRKVLEGKHPPAERARPSVGADWSRIVSRALCRNPEERYESAAAFASALRAELERLGFERPRRELQSFLRHPTEYWEAYVPRIVDTLVSLGRKAHTERDVPAAAACFNRALAFRPDDPELLRQVAGMAHAERVRRSIVRATAVLGAVVLMLGVAYGLVRVLRAVASRAAQSDSTAQARQGDGRAASGPVASSGARAAGSALAQAGARPQRAEAAHPRRPRIRNLPRPEIKMRPVRVHIDGAKNGKLTIDGQSAEWFGVTHELTVGRTYTFDFVAPDEECCVGMTRSVTIPEGEGEYRVTGKISFKRATLSTATVPAGSTVSCGLYGSVTAPAPLSVQLERPDATTTCLVTPPTGESERIHVSLRPGRTIPLSWP